VRLVAYTDNVELGGADLSLMHLLARVDADVEVTVLGVASRIVERVASARPSAAVRLVRRPTSGRDVRSLLSHLATLRDLAPDIVHVNLASPWSCQYAVAAAGLLRRPRVVAVYQLAVPPIHPGQLRAKRLTARGVDVHVGVGDRTSREVEALVGLPPGSVRTIHNGVPDEPTAPEALERLALELGVDDRVRWDGWSDDPRALLGAFDVFALPSRFEGFPLVVLEALLARAAVVATDVGSVAEAVVDGETGLLVAAEDPSALAAALRRALADADLRRRLGAQGRQLVLERFTADAMARAFESLYDELLSGDR
jgi:hypothetical protein